MISPLLASIPGILHAFGDLASPVPQIFELREEAGDASLWSARARHKQVHGVCVVEALAPSHECGEADALFTYAHKITLPIQTADCVPLLLARRDGGAVAGAHAGWRGTRAHIARRLWTSLESRGEVAHEWVAAVGPAIGPCCYEVSEELAADFAREFSCLAPSRAVPAPRCLDLPQINASELRECGLESVEILRACTRCATGRVELGGDARISEKGSWRFNSYRRDGSGTRQYSVIARI